MKAKCDWVTCLSASDYTVERKGNQVIFKDHRNKRAYELATHVAQQIRQQIGLLQPDRLWIQLAIDNALIPHPVDEWV